MIFLKTVYYTTVASMGLVAGLSQVTITDQSTVAIGLVITAMGLAFYTGVTVTSVKKDIKFIIEKQGEMHNKIDGLPCKRCEHDAITK